MNKYLKLSLVAVLAVSSFGMILSCSESDDGGKNKVEVLPNEVNLNPPSWLQGEWYDVEDLNNELIRINKDEVSIRLEVEGGGSKLVNFNSFKEAKSGVREDKQEDYYRIEFFNKENPEEILITYEFAKMENGNVRFCPVNTDKVKEHKELEGCKELVRK